jgi:hypothetical protein
MNAVHFPNNLEVLHSVAVAYASGYTRIPGEWIQEVSFDSAGLLVVEVNEDFDESCGWTADFFVSDSHHSTKLTFDLPICWADHLAVEDAESAKASGLATYNKAIELCVSDIAGPIMIGETI